MSETKILHLIYKNMPRFKWVNVILFDSSIHIEFTELVFSYTELSSLIAEIGMNAKIYEVLINTSITDLTTIDIKIKL